MNSEMQRRLYDMEVTPPDAVWQKLSLNIDEINEDNRVAQKVLNAELTPPAGVWERIDSTINFIENSPAQKKGTVINLRRLAVAALLIAVVVNAWIVIRNNNDRTGLAGIENPAPEQTSPNTNSTQENKDPNLIDSPVDRSTAKITENKVSQEKTNTLATPNLQSSRGKINNLSRNRNNLIAQPATAQYASLNTPLGKSFNEPIDDLSLVTSDQNYLTMVNANGRLVKIPAQLASLAPHLQDKPVSEDYYEVLFGEGAYWKETLNEWRKKLVSASASGDAFTSFVELLKSVQNK